jgi:glycine cleavage system H lipoate-binding protein
LCDELPRLRAARRAAQVNQSPFEDAWIMKVKLSNPAGAPLLRRSLFLR